MTKNFWLKIPKPILALAPMAGFTDSAFRQICKHYGADVLYSEMASVTAIFYNRKIKDNATLKLLKAERRKEKYYVVQLFGSDPEHFALATRMITKEVKPDGIDINFGCPVPKIVKQGAGSGLMKDLKKSRAVIEAVLANTDLPVSIKIRAQSGTIDALKFLKNISDLPVAAVMIHGRTLKQGFAGQPDWEMIKRARKYFSGIILANGGINDLAGAREALAKSGADGLGLARGVLGRPWLFREIKKNKEEDWSFKKISALIMRHVRLFVKLKSEEALIELRKHLPWYVQGRDGASRLRARLVKISHLADLKDILR